MDWEAPDVWQLESHVKNGDRMSIGRCRSVAVCLVSLLLGTLFALAQESSGLIRPEEYEAIGLVHDDAVVALGNRALFPVCISVPADTPAQPLAQYLRESGRAVLDPWICEPATSDSPEERTRDYPHGLRILVHGVDRYADGQISIRVQADDLTLRPGRDLGSILTKGAYRLKRDDKGAWQIVSYTKEFDSEDYKQDACGKKRTSSKK